MKRLLLLRIATDPVARVCSGVNPIIIPADAVEPSPARYLGGGALVNIPDLEQLLNGTASRIDITVSGVTAAALAIFQDEAHLLQGSDVHIGFAYQDDDWQITEVEWLQQFICGTPSTASKQANPGRSRSITISIGTDFTDRSKAPISLFTDADQHRRSSDDAIFDHVSQISVGLSRQFSPSS